MTDLMFYAKIIILFQIHLKTPGQKLVGVSKVTLKLLTKRKLKRGLRLVFNLGN